MCINAVSRMKTKNQGSWTTHMHTFVDLRRGIRMMCYLHPCRTKSQEGSSHSRTCLLSARQMWLS
jgi:hypothetical protein